MNDESITEERKAWLESIKEGDLVVTDSWLVCYQPKQHAVKFFSVLLKTSEHIFLEESFLEESGNIYKVRKNEGWIQVSNDSYLSRWEIRPASAADLTAYEKVTTLQKIDSHLDALKKAEAAMLRNLALIDLDAIEKSLEEMVQRTKGGSE
jgi:hypothetical protein